MTDHMPANASQSPAEAGYRARPEYAVPLERAMDRLVVKQEYDSGTGPGPHVHTYLQAGPMLLGAHWPLETVRELFEQRGVEEAGSGAAARGHCLTSWYLPEHGSVTPEWTPVWFEARPVSLDP